MSASLDPAMAERLARLALGHVERPWPHGLSHVFGGPEDATPSVLHPVFFGSLDWHSCVHGYWLLARVLRRDPAGECAGAITALFDRRLTAEAVRGECRYFERPSARGFERPYGWAWLLKLAAELTGTRWAEALAPLAATIVERFGTFLPIATHPVRAGTHGNTAFALRLAADYPDAGLRRMVAEASARWYGADRDCTAWGEPSGDDFLSPALMEAECMRRLHGDAGWQRRFLPELPAVLRVPVRPSDRSDGKIAHLDGLNLSRAWCLRSLGRGWDDVAATHLEAALPHLDGHYMGSHWLATFALLALDEPA